MRRQRPGGIDLICPTLLSPQVQRGVTVVPKAAGVLFTPVRAQIDAVASGVIGDEVHLCKAALVNKRVHTVSTGVDQIKDDDDTTTLVTMTPQDGGNDVIEIIPS